MYARTRVMGSYISNRNVCAQTWNLFNDDRCTLPENWTRMLEPACQERHWRRKMFERGLSHRGLPLKRKFRPRCCAKTRAGAPCIMRVVPGKRRCRFHGGLSTGPKTKAGRARIEEVQRRRWKAFRGVARLSQTGAVARRP